jgi:site-specific DNA recombinase
VVVVAAPGRLARSYVHQVLLIDELAGYGFRVEFLDRPMSGDPHDQLLLQIRGAVAEYERSGRPERASAMPRGQNKTGSRTSPNRPQAACRQGATQASSSRSGRRR